MSLTLVQRFSTEVSDDQSRVTDWIGGEGGGLSLGHFGAQPFGGLSDG